ncbi:phage holin family protein [Arachnia propionica]|nr:phage holin family protein [Arachnia propionica]MDO5083970.1 phage holin family protein [Arachnia propionica]
MASTPTTFQKLRDSLTEFVARESELAKAELIPAAKHAGIGSGLAAGAAAFLFHAAWMLVITLGFGIGWLFNALAGVSLMGSLTLGFLISMVLSLIVAAVLALLARGRFLRVEAPHATIEEARATFTALTDSLGGQPSPAVTTHHGIELDGVPLDDSVA